MGVMSHARTWKESSLGGWKTWTSVALTGMIAVLQALEGFAVIPAGIANTVSLVLAPIAAMFGLTGLGHKIVKGPQ